MTQLDRLMLNERFDRMRQVVPTLAIGIVLLFTLAWTFATVSGATAYQRDIRAARAMRAAVFRLQLDEETGLRGLAATGDRRFLDPFNAARPRLPTAFDVLRDQLQRIGAPAEAVAAAAEERRVNGVWLTTFAAPLLANPRSGTAGALQLRAKGLMDEFRRHDASIAAALDDASIESDRRSQDALWLMALTSVLAATALGLLQYLFSVRQRKLRSALDRERKRYESERALVDAMQQAFAQRPLPDSARIGLHGVYVPAGERAQVGGDWYDAFALPDGRILFTIGDVAGHGLPAAVAMSQARQALIAAAMQERDPGDVLRRANAVLQLQEPRMVTAVCGFVDPNSLEIVYASAGHPPPIVVGRDRPARILPSAGLPLGVESDVDYRSFVAHAAPETMLVLYTDGVIEERRDLIEGERRLLAAVDSVRASADPASAILAEVFAGARPRDDVAVLTLTFRAPGQIEAGAAVAPREIDLTRGARADEAWFARLGVNGASLRS